MFHACWQFIINNMGVGVNCVFIVVSQPHLNHLIIHKEIVHGQSNILSFVLQIYEAHSMPSETSCTEDGTPELSLLHTDQLSSDRVGHYNTKASE